MKLALSEDMQIAFWLLVWRGFSILRKVAMNYLLHLISFSNFIFFLIGSTESFPDGKYVECRVLKGIPKHALVDVSLRSSRVDGDLDDDVPPEVGETIQGYVVETNKKGCFIRIARNVEGRVTLKELCDGFLPDPPASFPTGRLVAGSVKGVRDAPKKTKHANNPVKYQVDLDMRESTLLGQKKQLTFDDIEVEKKYKGTVTRVESYGVFVQIEGSNISGLSHMSECSDKFIKKLGSLYDPGDLVKVLVIKKDAENKKLGFSMKASHFEDDEDSDDDDASASSDDDENMVDNLDSEDENFGAKLASKMDKDDDADSDSDDSSGDSSASEDGSDSDSDDDSDAAKEDAAKDSQVEMDTGIGFDWGARGLATKNKSSNGKEEDSSDDSSDDSDDNDSDDDDAERSSSHKSRKKQSQRRREEKEIARRETALADGTADENPETAGDFERLLAGNPNSSELWIRYMAFYLSLADIPSARKVAEKALGRIEFRQETEKLNVWTAVMTLEHKYGTDDSLQKTIDRACGHCNPKQVYLRVCEILEKDASATPESGKRANAMYTKMCKKFKSKKKVWLAHLEYLLKRSRHQEAHALLKRALLSLASYKHAETMSKFAQLEFEYGSAERARTLFDGILERYPKRLDLFFVYLDKEIKFGKVASARSSLEQKVQQAKLSDKQMKSLFKKWFRMEEEYGSDEQQQYVKDTARDYVQRTT